MRISVILKKDSLDFKGEFLSAHNRTQWLLKNFPEAEVTIYLLSEYDGSLGRIIKRKKRREKVPSLIFDNLEYHYLWHKSSLTDSIVSRFGFPRLFTFSAIRAKMDDIGKSDLIIAHSFYSGYLALKFYQKYGTPYTVTWHGSDIHSTPFCNKSIFAKTKEIIECAAQNFFVSKKLLDESERIYVGGNKKVLYNGVNTDVFRPRPTKDIESIKMKNNISINAKSVAFIGNLYPVKNVCLLPEIFAAIRQKFTGEISFHIIGDGFLRKNVEKKAQELGVTIRFWGNMPPEDMPTIINCMDLVVLPSKNEGLPLITLETIACGVNIIGSNVGGIAEAIGKENTINLTKDFVEEFSELACYKLQNSERPKLKEQFLWETIAKIEKVVIENIIDR